MMLHSIRLALLLIAALLVTSTVVSLRMLPAADAPTQTRVSELVDRLQAKSLQQRVQAERALRRLGPAALPYLPTPQSLAPGPADAVRRLRIDLESQLARESLEASRVGLQGTLRLEEILQSVSQQTGNVIDVSQLPADVLASSLTVEMTDVPFWFAVGQLETLADISLSANSPSRALVATWPKSARPAVGGPLVVGPFRMMVRSVRVRRDFTDESRQLLRVTFEVECEPRLRPLFAYVADADFVVEGTPPAGDDGRLLEDDPRVRVLPAFNPEASREIPIDKPGRWQFSYDAIVPAANDAPQLTSVGLQGRFEIEVATGAERFEFRHLDEPGPVTRRHGGVQVTLVEATRADSDLRTTLRIAYDAASLRFESHRAWVYHNEAALSDGEGHTLGPAEYETLQESDSSVTLRYRFADVAPAKEWKLQYTAPTLIARMAVPFSLDRLPIDNAGTLSEKK